MLYYIFAILGELLRMILLLFLGLLLAVGLAFFAAHAIDNWDAPEHPHSGFSPEYHTAHLEY